MVSVRGNQTNNKVTASSSTSTNNRAEVKPVNTNNQVESTNNLARYYSNISQEWAISDRIVENTDYSSKYYANESKKQADISTAKTAEVVESGNNTLTNIDNARDNAITDITNQENLSVDNVNTAGITQVANVNSAGTIQVNLAKEQAVLATNQANIATEQATIATSQASIATSKSIEVVESGNTALSNIETAKSNALNDINTTGAEYVNNAEQYAQNALNSANNAKTSENNALSYKNSAMKSSQTATEQASIATTNANKAITSATNAKTSETNAKTSETRCEEILSRLGTAIKIKGRVNGLDDLPLSGNLDGDAYLIGEEGLDNYPEYYWYKDHWEFLGTSGISLSWGLISGDITAQTDLKNALDAKQDKGNYALKSEIPTKISQLTDDSTFVHKTGNETVVGVKTFTGNPVFQSADYGNAMTVKRASDGGVSSVIKYANNAGELGRIGANGNKRPVFEVGNGGQKLIVLGASDGTAVGSTTKPVYISSTGIATPITSYEGNSATATKATQDGNGRNIVNTYQQKLTAGENIKIESNVISSTSLGHKNITNCLTEVPQMIKADIVDGTLTVHAGSKCIVPYGTDAPTYSVGDFLLGEANNNLYKIVDIQYDAYIDYPVLDHPLLFYTVEVQRDISRDVSSLSTSTVYLINLIVNSTIEPGLDIDYCDVRLVGTTNSANNKYLVYDTTTNYVLSDTGHYSVGTLPVLVYNNREFLNIFDCVGFIGNIVYIHKNISMLMGIGKNPDGSQKNIEYTTDKLYLHQISTTVSNYFYYVGFENGVSIDPSSKKLIFDNPNTTFVGTSSLGTFISSWKMWNFRTGKWEFYNSKMNDGVPFQVHNAIFGRLWFEDGKIIRIYLNPTGMLKTDEEKGVTTSEQDSLSAMSVLASGTNLNSFRKAGTYYFSGSYTPSNIPTGVNGILQVITNNERTLVKQIWFRHGTINSNDTQTWIRTYAPTNTETNTYGWSNWQQLIPQFVTKKANPGFLKSGGMIVQGGSYKMSSNNGDKVITFPTAFSNTNYCVIAKRMGGDDNDYESGATAGRTTTSCKIHSWGGYTYSWIAFGY